MMIDLEKYLDQNETSLIGSKFVRKIRSQMPNLLSKEESDDPQIVIIIPDTIVTISKSFFKACFHDRIKKLGAMEFSKKYYFHASNHTQMRVKKMILDCVKEI